MCICVFLKPSHTVHLVPALVLYRRGFPAVQRDRGILRNSTGHPSLSFPRTSFHCPAFSWQRFNWILLLVFSWPAEFLVWHKRLLWQESWLTLHLSLLPLVLFHCTCFKSSHQSSLVLSDHTVLVSHICLPPKSGTFFPFQGKKELFLANKRIVSVRVNTAVILQVEVGLD